MPLAVHCSDDGLGRPSIQSRRSPASLGKRVQLLGALYAIAEGSLRADFGEYSTDFGEYYSTDFGELYQNLSTAAWIVQESGKKSKGAGAAAAAEAARGAAPQGALYRGCRMHALLRTTRRRRPPAGPRSQPAAAARRPLGLLLRRLLGAKCAYCYGNVAV